MTSVAEFYTDGAEDNFQTLQLALPVAVPCVVNSNRELLTQFFVNLVENTITHCPRDTTIIMSLTHEADFFRACVSDIAIGISEEDREPASRCRYRLDKS